MFVVVLVRKETIRIIILCKSAFCFLFQCAGFTSQWAAWCCSEAEPTCSVTGSRSLFTGPVHVSLATAGHTASSTSHGAGGFLCLFPLVLVPFFFLSFFLFCINLASLYLLLLSLLLLLFSHAVMPTAAADLGTLSSLLSCLCPVLQWEDLGSVPVV